MRLFRSLTLLAILFSTASAQAAITWSGCGTISSISNYIANSNQFFILLSPAGAIPPACTAIGGVPGSVSFMIGQDGVTSANFSSLLAIGMQASATGQPVMIAYDNSTSSCYGQVIAIGGYSAQC